MMSLKSLNNVLLSAVALLVLTLMSACSKDAVDSYEDIKTDNDVASYINLTISVSNGTENMTRAGEKPAAGESGDGREAGFARENAITGITFILYKDATGGPQRGINHPIEPEDPATDIPLSFVAYYPVSLISTEVAGTTGVEYNSEPPTPPNEPKKTDEAFYTTGNQRIAKNTIDFTEKNYYAIVIANADLRGQVATLGDVRNYKMSSLYGGGTEKDPAQNCVNFIMSSEDNYKFTIPAPVASPAVGGNLLYTIVNPIHIERMAARIDFWAANSNGYKDNTNNAAYTTPGYEYNVIDPDDANCADKFVVTGITPFNLNGYDYSNGNGGEYLIKRLANEVSASATISYLIDETGSNFVLDPATTVKTNGNLTYFKNTLQTLAGQGTLADITSLSSNTYYKSVANLHSALTVSDNSAGFTNLSEGSLSGEDVIIAYPMENTLWKSSVLYNYATGLAIEGDYYTSGIDYTNPANKPTHLIYYGYLRHQGSSTSAYAATQGKNMSKTASTTAANCMEFGIVRNNIYRVSIEKVNVVEGTIKLKIEEKHWRHVDNPIIYI